MKPGLDALHERVARELDEHMYGAWRSGSVANHVLAALGLDDLDAAAARVVEHIGNMDCSDYPCDPEIAKDILLDALTPPER